MTLSCSSREEAVKLFWRPRACSVMGSAGVTVAVVGGGAAAVMVTTGADTAAGAGRRSRTLSGMPALLACVPLASRADGADACDSSMTGVSLPAAVWADTCGAPALVAGAGG